MSEFLWQGNNKVGSVLTGAQATWVRFFLLKINSTARQLQQWFAFTTANPTTQANEKATSRSDARHYNEKIKISADALVWRVFAAATVHRVNGPSKHAKMNQYAGEDDENERRWTKKLLCRRRAEIAVDVRAENKIIRKCVLNAAVTWSQSLTMHSRNGARVLLTSMALQLWREVEGKIEQSRLHKSQ